MSARWTPFVSRRGFFGSLAAAGALSMLPPEMVKSFAAPPARGTLADVRHVVVVMQENRSFDHYYGTMSGVRGFGDRAAVTLPDGGDVFRQPGHGGEVLPYRVDTARTDGEDDTSLDHGWQSQHQAAADGVHNGWVAAKGPAAMAYLGDADIPFHRALADAFTLCDAYHCSVLGPTTPNRLYLLSGTIDPAGRAGGPVTENPADYRPVLGWQTYPEFLSAHGVSWRVYANDEVGDDQDEHPFLGDYGDNPLWLFHRYHADYDSELSRRAGVFAEWKQPRADGLDPAHVLSDFLAEVDAGTLPEVSWIVAPYGYCEHPAGRPLNGAVYLSTLLRALWDNQDVWNSTVVLLNYDENDGLFDHVPPPTPQPGTADEFVDGVPIGLGFRVPMTVISPWSRGGWVNSELFDHTSVIRFIEAWKHPDTPFPNISAWRRAVCGDLTGCFRFDDPDAVPPNLPAVPGLAVPPGSPHDPERGLPQAVPPAADRQSMPTQAAGRRQACALPYQPAARVALSPDGLVLRVELTNDGAAAVCLSGRSGHAAHQFTVPARGRAASRFPILDGRYDLAVHGPNGFRWHYAGDTAGPAAALHADACYTAAGGLALTLRNDGQTALDVTVAPTHYHQVTPLTMRIAPGSVAVPPPLPLRAAHGWYDVIVTVAADAGYRRRFTGHYEDGAPSHTG
jgi:phospholipase C